MKLVTEYLERVIQLERLAAGESNSEFKAQLLAQADAYRKLAANRAAQQGLPQPRPPEDGPKPPVFSDREQGPVCQLSSAYVLAV